MTKLVPYLRVSTDEQSVDSSGQLHAIQTWAARAGVDLLEPCQDNGVSGALGPDKRPGLARALELCSGRRRGKPAGIVAYDRTRLCRSASLAGHLAWLAKQGGFRLVTTDGYDSEDSSDSALIIGAVQGAFGELQRRAIASATKKALQARKAAGRAYGEVPYGFRREGDLLVPEPAERAVLVRMQALGYYYADWGRFKGPAYARIARRLNSEGFPARNGREWSRGMVKHLLTRLAAETSAESPSRVESPSGSPGPAALAGTPR